MVVYGLQFQVVRGLVRADLADHDQVNDALTDAVDFVRQNAEADPEEYTEQKTETEKVSAAR